MERYVEIEDGRVRVYSDGRVYNVGKSRFIAPILSSSRSLVLALPAVEGKNVMVTVKRLVYEAFVKPCGSTPILHIDNDIMNCGVDNLYLLGDLVEEVMVRNRPEYPLTFHALSREPYPRYAASKQGEVYDVMTRRELKGYLSNAGYFIIAPFNLARKKFEKVRKHRFIHFCWNESFDITDPTRIINHIDGVRSNNVVSNLEEVTTAENNEKSFITNPGRATRSRETKTAVFELVSGCGNIEVLKMSLRAAAKRIGCTQRSTMECVRTGTPIDGKILRHAFEDRNDESWYRVLPYTQLEWYPEGVKDLAGILVSDQGRIAKSSGTVYSGKLYEDGDFQRVIYAGAQKLFHQVLCFAFRGPPPSPEHSVDHANRDDFDNRPVNLQWKDKTEQSSNTRRAKHIVRTCSTTGEVTIYNTKKVATQQTGVSHMQLTRICASGVVYQGATWSEHDAPIDPEPDTVPVGHPDLTEPVPYEHVRMIVHRGGEKYC